MRDRGDGAMAVRLSGKQGMTMLVVVAGLVVAGFLGNHWLQQRRVGGAFGNVLVVRPHGEPRALVLLLGQARSPDLDQAAQALAKDGAVVGIVDATRYLAHHPDQCEAASNELKWLGLRVLRGAGVDQYLAPMLVGMGNGGTLVRQALASSAAAWPGATIVGEDAVTAATCEGKPVQAATVSRLPAKDWVATAVQRFPPAVPQFRGLPLIELPHAGSDRLVILMSGDGGWAALDKDVAEQLHRQGYSVLGWNSLRYFWSEKSPERAAADLSAVIAEYRQRWHVTRVDLVGYSFGADVMPFLYARLPADQQAQVRTVSLLGLSSGTGFTVRIGGWLGWSGGDTHPVAPQLQAIPTDKLLCVYGEEEEDSLCPSLRASGIAVRMTPGGHHFGTSEELTGLITDHWQPAMVAATASELSPAAAAPAP
ncbi:virulence factor family protein [Pseudoxanthomonas sp. GM95]|uniref:virulence factor family protein n=1 Tax=Pseudoxanthomonas sp. GM95 TaxID=1881043 RepID=UPI001587514D|nr:virulence factor family protein [Pseudoxanthomonas sp. GM95]